MSRCFPFPPPNYRKEDAALIESIKLEEAQQQAKEKRNEHKKEKKERKEEKKERKEKHVKSNGEHNKSKHKEHRHKKRKHNDGTKPHKANDTKAAVTDVVEQLEKSGLTEEYELPYSAREWCESPESTQNSWKSRKLEATAVSRGGNGGTILRFRLPMQKHIEPEPNPASRAPQLSCRMTTPKVVKAKPALEEACFSGRSAPTIPETMLADERLCFPGKAAAAKVVEAKNATDNLCYSVRTAASRVLEAAAPVSEAPCFSGRTAAPQFPEAAPANQMRRSDPVVQAPSDVKLVEDAHIQCSAAGSSKRSRRMDKYETQFRDLTAKWTPLPLALDAAVGDDDQGWLLGNPLRCKVRADANSCVLASSSEGTSHVGDVSSFQPRACFLPEFDMYQLPYAVPF